MVQLAIGLRAKNLETSLAGYLVLFTDKAFQGYRVWLKGEISFYSLQE